MSNKAFATKHPPKLQQKKLMTKWATVGTDGAFQAGLGEGLVAFNDRRQKLGLDANETKFYIPIGDLPVELQATSPDRTRRVCIADDSTGDTRLEVSWADAVRSRSLHERSDMGSNTFPSKLWMFGRPGTKTRGWVWPDPAHRRHNNVDDAMKDNDIHGLKQEALLSVNVGHAPWHGCGHHGKFSDG